MLRTPFLIAVLVGCSSAVRAQHVIDSTLRTLVEDAHARQCALSEYVRGPMLLHVWGTWCSECLEVAPRFNRLADSLCHDSVDVVNVAIEVNGFAHWKNVSKRVGTGIQLYYDAEHSTDTSGYLGLPWIKSIPVYIAIDRDRRVVGEWYELPTLSAILDQMKR